jgi:SAM-dependent methyltransferase
MLRAAGIGPGMRVLDVGCGVGDVSFLVAELTAPSGSVVGIDVDPEALTLAEQRRPKQAPAPVSFIHGDVRTADFPDLFDAAVGRLVLMYHADPTTTLRAVAACVRPGGVVAFQEVVFEGGMPAELDKLPLFSLVLSWIRGVYERSGAHINLGLELWWRMRDAGLEPHATPLAEVPMDTRPDSLAYSRYASLIRSLLPRIVDYGLATEAEVAVDTLERRLRDEALPARAALPLFHLLVGQWARRRTADDKVHCQ